MADNDLEIRVRSSADLAALKQAQSAIDDLAARTQRINRAQIEADTARFAARTGLPLPGTPTEAFGFGTGGAGTQGLTTVAADMDRVASASLLVGANLARARNEAVTFIREMASGAPTTRTLGALLGALGFEIAGIAAAFGTVPFITAKIIEHEQNINNELDHQLTKLNDAAHKWQDVARGSESAADVQKVAKDALPVLDEAAAKVNELQNQQQGFMKNIVDQFTKAGGFGGTVFEHQTEKAINRLAQIREEAAKIAGGAIRVGQEFERAFESDRLRTAQEVIAQTTDNVRKWKDEQSKLNLTTEGGIKQWSELQSRIEAAVKSLQKWSSIRSEEQKQTEKQTAAGGQSLFRTPQQELNAQTQEFANIRAKAAVARAEHAQLLFETQGRARTPEEQARLDELGREAGPEAGRAALRAERAGLSRFLGLQEELTPGVSQNVAFGETVRPQIGQTTDKIHDAQARISEIDKILNMNKGGNANDLSETNQILRQIYQQWQ